MQKTISALACVSLIATFLTPFPSAAQNNITIVSPFAAGGTSDVISRAVARGIEPILKSSVIVENIVGAGGSIGIGNVARAKPDGSRIVMGGVGSLVFSSIIQGKALSYNAQADLVALAQVAAVPTVLAVSKAHPAQTLGELIAALKKEPDKVGFGSAGTGGSFHLAGVLFQKLTGVKINHVPYRGGAPMMTDLVGGHLPVGFADTTLVAPQLGSGAVRALAIVGPKRSPALPNIPTAAEAGVPGLELVTWYGLMAPKGTPPETLKRIADAVLEVAKGAELRELLTKQAMEPLALGPAEFAKVVDGDFKRWQPIIAELGLKPAEKK